MCQTRLLGRIRYMIRIFFFFQLTDNLSLYCNEMIHFTNTCKNVYLQNNIVTGIAVPAEKNLRGNTVLPNFMTFAKS